MLANVVVEFRWFVRQIVAQFGAHGLLDSAASLTYTTLFAVVPLMTVSYTILSMFPDFSTMGQQIQAFVFQNFVPASSAVIQERLEDFSRQARELTIAGFAFLLVTAFMMLVTMEKAFNEIWQVAEPRRGMQRFFVYWAVLTCGPPLVVAGLLISSYLISLPLISNPDTVVARQALLGWLPVLFSFIGLHRVVLRGAELPGAPSRCNGRWTADDVVLRRRKAVLHDDHRQREHAAGLRYVRGGAAVSLVAVPRLDTDPVRCDRRSDAGNRTRRRGERRCADARAVHSAARVPAPRASRRQTDHSHRSERCGEIVGSRTR